MNESIHQYIFAWTVKLSVFKIAQTSSCVYVSKVPDSKFFLQIFSRTKGMEPLPRKVFEFSGLQFRLNVMVYQEKKVGDPKKLWGARGVGRAFPRAKPLLAPLPSTLARCRAGEARQTLRHTAVTK